MHTDRVAPASSSAPPAGAGRSTVRVDEVERFDRLAGTWWDPTGPMRPLHVTNALRLGLVVDLMHQHFGRAAAASLAGLQVLDVGCGAGLLAEPLAERGASVLGIDASPRNIGAAQRHAESKPALAGRLGYRVGEPTTALNPGDRFDVVLALEVVEHVDAVPLFVRQVAARVKPGGLLFCSTIDRTAKSWLFAIVGAEYVLRVLPVGTHRWRQFVRPAELDRAAADAGLARIALRGMRYLPVLHRASWTDDTSVNYLAVYQRHESGSPRPTP
jgi:2-polyprenyl-6-hydroxyphenyl methylase/3-demethylubiquinone-9 3-methyltransferase